MELFLFLMLVADNQEIFDMVLHLTAYHYPENIVLPQGIQACNLILICHKLIFFTLGYTPPNLAVSTLYWKAWLMLLMLIAHNPGSLGSEAWNSFPPILRALMEMCITNDLLLLLVPQTKQSCRWLQLKSKPSWNSKQI
jgi:integrator complex subunit 1